jgi:hypothetical protein
MARAMRKPALIFGHCRDGLYTREDKRAGEKDFEGGLRAILIKEKHTTENIDSRNCLLAVKNCTLIVGHRLFQQHRPKGDMRANNARACERRVRNDLSSSCRRQSAQSIQKRTSQLRAPRAAGSTIVQHLRMKPHLPAARALDGHRGEALRMDNLKLWSAG